MYMYITESFYGNAGTVNYAACSFVKTPCWKYFLAFHVSIEKKIDRIAYSDASVIVIKSRKSKGYTIADTVELNSFSLLSLFFSSIYLFSLLSVIFGLFEFLY